ncbi:hypothetical protein CAP36_08350 [Chitinophagaceae bacterium IBVUCB2]|nr:hypothetical protein CAP36_08350 [Chitinophagaceae bacterium IBVUCB2]
MEQGWDPDVKKFLLKVLNSISLVLLWMLVCATLGIYYKLGYTSGYPIIYPIIFYACMAITLYFVIRHLIKLWNK